MIIQEPIKAAIASALNNYDYKDAIFLSECLLHEVGNDEALYLLATSMYRSGKAFSAYSLLEKRGYDSPQLRLLFAQCCMDLDKIAEAQTVLAGNLFGKGKSVEEISNEFGDLASYAFRLLAKICRKTDRTEKATEYLKKCLKLNPFLWSSYEQLCELGECVDSSKVFVAANCPNFCTTTYHTNETCPQMSAPTISISRATPLSQTQESSMIPASISSSLPTQTPNPSPSNQSQPCSERQPIIASGGVVTPVIDTPDSHQSLFEQKMKPAGKPATELFCALSKHSPLTPSFGVLPLDMTASPADLNFSPMTPQQRLFGLPAKPIKPPKMPRPRRSPAPNAPVFSLSQCQSGNTNNSPAPTSVSGSLQSSNFLPGSLGSLRRSTRLFTNSTGGNSVKENNKTQSQKLQKFQSPKSPAKKSKSKTLKTPQELNEINKTETTRLSPTSNSTSNPMLSTPTPAQVYNCQLQSAEGLMSLLQEMGRAYLALSQYDCAKAVELFSNLPVQHLNSGWVLTQLGKAYFEMANYYKAEKIFSKLRLLEPYRMEGMEIYSTTLWHLQREVDLSYLAKDLTDIDKKSPQAWCAVGNCFSLQKEHDVAIKFFGRAVQIDPDFVYGYTLLGHEYVLTEELETGMRCYRNALNVNERHYNAWYGIGMIYYKQENFKLAEVHFRQALSINHQSSVLLCHVGVVQHALKKPDQALATFEQAMSNDPKNPLCKFHRASTLFAMDKYEDSLKELEELRKIAPKEALVFFLLGKVQKKLGHTHLALMNFSWAMDLDPKGSNNQIKEAIDKHYATEDNEPLPGPSDTIEEFVEASSNNSSLLESDDMQLEALESDDSL